MKRWQSVVSAWDHRDRSPWLGWVVVGAGLATWTLVTETGLVPPLYLPAPSEVVRAASDLGLGIVVHAAKTTGLLIAGYLLGVILGVGLGIAMSYYPKLRAALGLTIESWRPVPPVALVPFFLLWFRFSLLGRLTLIAFGVCLIMVVATLEAVRGVRPTYVRAAMSLGANRRDIYRTVILPAIVPELRSGLRIALAIGMGLEIVSEFLGAQAGLGYLINIAKVTFSTHTILLSIVILGTIAATLDAILQWSVRRLAPWWRGIEDTFG